MADNRVQKILTKRSGDIYDGMKARALEVYMSIPFTKEEFRAWLYPKFGADGVTRCEYSGAQVLAEDFQVDHRQPTSRFGQWGFDNLAICTKAQNLRKGNMTKGEYAIFCAHVLHHGYPEEVQESIFKRLEIGDVQRYAHFRRENKKRGKR